jgi:8-oxo-dGTP diphosphatase
VRILRALPYVDHDYDWGTVRLVPFVCELVAGSPEPVAREHAELVWTGLAQMESFTLAPADLPVLKMLRDE